MGVQELELSDAEFKLDSATPNQQAATPQVHLRSRSICFKTALACDGRDESHICCRRLR